MLTVLEGDALTMLRTLPAESVQCCVTSPPYWGLRDYGTAAWEGGDSKCDHLGPSRAQGGEAARPKSDTMTIPYRDACGKCGARRIDAQLGLEPTPELYVANMVEVFREVRRVLRKDGTLWLNLSSSYFGSGQGGNPEDSPHQKQRTNRGSFSYDKRPTRSHPDDPACGTDDIEQADSLAPDSGCPDLCDECRAALSNHKPDTYQFHPEFSSGFDSITYGDAQEDLPLKQPAASPPDVLKSTTIGSSPQPQAECFHCANCGACLSVLASATRDASLCARKAGYNSDNAVLGSVVRRKDKDVSDSAYSTITFPKFKAKDLVPIPWMVAMALQADGWYLRSDIIWSKCNPMPESVTDRPTKAHEYVFLLTKSANYFYDAEAIKEQSIHAGEVVFNNNGKNSLLGDYGATREGFLRPEGVTVAPNRNKRSVWTVPTSPYPDAHFATYPPDLIKPMIMAGSRIGDVILDPFAGSGTTGQVAIELGRRATLIELNPHYVKLIEQRCSTTIGLPLA